MALNINVKALTEQKNELITRAEEIVNKAAEEKRDLTDDETKELTQLRDDAKKIQRQLRLADDFEALDDRKEKMEKRSDDSDESEHEPTTEEIEEQETRAFDAYIRGVALNERASDLTKGSNGAIIPKTIAKKIIDKVYDICPILEKSTKYNVKGTLEIPYYDETEDTITVAFADEFTSLEAHSGKFNTISLTGYLAGALTKISKSLINNTDFNVVSFVIEHMALAVKRFIEDALLNGANDKVTGLSTLSNELKAASKTAITADEIIHLRDKVKDAYQNNAMWIMSAETRTALRLLKDTNGKYLLNDDISSPFGTTLLGKPVYVSDNMKGIGAGNTCIYYGDFSGLATKFSEEFSAEVLREKYADQHVVGVIGWFEFDSKVENAQKLVRLVCAS